MPRAKLRQISLWLVGLGFLFFPGFSPAKETLRLTGVGLNEFYSQSLPTPVEVHIPPVAAPSVRIEIVIESGPSFPRVDFTRVDKFSQTFPMIPGQPLDAEIPVMIPAQNHILLTLTAYLPDGSSRGTLSRPISSDATVSGPRPLDVALCQEDALCEKIQADAMFNGTPAERQAKSKGVRWAFLASPLSHWWSYSAARVIVVAVSTAKLSPDQRLALEEFVRGGGYLILLEKEAADPSFLAGYRRVPFTKDETVIVENIGRGKLIRIPSEGVFQQAINLDRRLEKPFIGDPNEFVSSMLDNTPDNLGLLKMVGIRFHFPRLRWVLIALGVYILIVGPLNFFVLRRMGRLDWGWVTVSALAVFFALAFYFAGSARRPRIFTVDEASTYVMDDQSPLAAEALSFRAAAPDEDRVALAISGQVYPSVRSQFGLDFQEEPDSMLNAGALVTNKPLQSQGWNVRLGDPLTLAFSLLRWSYRDYSFTGFRMFPGTVHWTSPRHLKNDAGETFGQAFYFDYTENTRYYLPRMAPGEEVDLDAVKHDRIWDYSTDAEGRRTAAIRLDPNGAFDPAGFPYFSGPDFGSHVFEGVAENPQPAVKWVSPGTNRNILSLTLVEMKQP